MGGATAAIGFLPTFKTIGYLAPVLLILIRVLQGWRSGRVRRRRGYTCRTRSRRQARLLHQLSIQITATGGSLFSLGVILLVQESMSKNDFRTTAAHSFLISIALVAMSLYIRLR